MSTPNTAHTPTPWEASMQSGLVIFGAPKTVAGDVVRPIVATCSTVYPESEARANAAHIVLCVNSHDKLREALRETLALLPYGNEALALKAETTLKESEAK